MELTSFIPLMELKRPSSLAVTSCSITLAEAFDQLYETLNDGNDLDGSSWTSMNGITLIPISIKAMNMIMTEKAETGFLFVSGSFM